ncbi:RNA polymerase sigma-70 factor, ECF subfamily [Aureimonas altamirensis DSM 21988]|uniref:RNA polymerase sigma factor, sigma-70 family n=2 Tax=Aureimonas altamirensis TaxID=370622 RepID=A0A0P0YVP8_9HYPH|nr:sigma-70 family RNA polymerase sigma factor [Aureimonas altamirensis]BAT25472.1 RNA polymerase sigma factor, sigma-70 family [Aureimonas altamirensis]SHK01916.1 RNA polymerase sigma-70 factor, ECF subfamily [Aureimonas altamirensis DSM 21988]
MHASEQKSLIDAAIETYYDEIRSAVSRRGASSSQATEIVHDLYIALSGKPRALDGARSIKAFLIKAAINLGIDRGRRAAFEARLFAALDAQAIEIPADRTDITNLLDRPRRLACLRAAILELPPQCRTVFVAHRLGSVTKEEIATALGIQRRMVDRHLRKALLHCLDRMDEFDSE